MSQARAEGTRQHRHRGTKELRKTGGSQHPLGKLFTAPRNKPNSPQSAPESPVTLSGRHARGSSPASDVSHISQLRHQLASQKGDQQGQRFRETLKSLKLSATVVRVFDMLKENSSVKSITEYNRYRPILQKVKVKSKRGSPCRERQRGDQ